MQIRRILTLCLIIGLAVAAIQPHQPDAVGRRGMVVSGSMAASRVGLNVLRVGGNAIDAAVATGFALAVTLPGAGNIGGGGFMVIRLEDGTTTTIDFRERAPAAAGQDMYLDENGNVINDLSTTGVLASGVPGTVRGLGLAHSRYGRLSWESLVAPAVELAEAGIAVPYQLHRDLIIHSERLSQFDETKRIFYPNNGEPLRLNALFQQPELAATLQRIASLGPDEFYTGETARLLVAHMQNHGGLITSRDLADYQAIERPPIEFDYRNTHIISMGPPSAGGIILAQILNQLEMVDLSQLEFHSAEHIHVMVEAARRAYADRARYLGDADFVTVPVGQLISKAYADRRWQDVSLNWATPSENVSHGDIKLLLEPEETTHFSIVDRWGNAVAVTTTINASYGSGEVVEGAGFFLNNEMDDFSIKPGYPNIYGLIGSQANAIEPGKRMLSSMTPTIVTRNDSLVMIIGTPGGSTITTTVSQIISNVVDFNLDIKSAVEAPRIHHQWIPDEIVSEALGISLETKNVLTRMGHNVRYRDDLIGAANCIYVDPETGWYHGAADTRREAGAAGY